MTLRGSGAASAWTARPGGKIEELESLRGLAALLVVFFHMPIWHPWLEIGLFRHGYLMVELFFVLSGYVIFNAYGNRIGSPGELLRFQWLRFGRLYPVHLLFLLCFLAIEIAKLALSGSHEPAFSQNNGIAFIEQLLLVQAIGPTGNAYTFNSPAWSISTEFYTYLLFAAVVLLARRWRIALFATLATAAFVALLLFDKSADILVLYCLTGFFLGCVVCWLLQRTEFELPAIAFPLALLALVAYVSTMQPGKADLWVFPLSALLIVALLRSRKHGLVRIMRSRILVWLGARSYSVYMSHSLVISLILMAMKRGLETPQILPWWEAAVVVALSVIAVLVVSEAVYRVVEVPLRERSRHLAARFSPARSRGGQV